MKKRIVFFSEAAYAAGMLLMALGGSLSAHADLGMSMVVAPAYILHLALSPKLSWFSFGVAEYVVQAILIAGLAIYLKKFRVTYLFSIITAFLYGLVLDGITLIVAPLETDLLLLRIVYFILGGICCAAAVALFLKTYLAPEAYELVAKELPLRKGWPLVKVKTIYDIASCVISIAMTLIIFREFRGVGIGTVILAAVNGRLIGLFSDAFDKTFELKDKFGLRDFFSQ